MALEKVVTEDKIEIVGEYKAVQVRTCTKVLEDGVELSSGYHRHVIMRVRTTATSQQKYKLSVRLCIPLKS
jgi:hypothetical protein